MCYKCLICYNLYFVMRKKDMSKMAAKSKKRLSKNENKLLKLEKLELKDVICSICQSVLIEPVTLPCYHDFCQRCFNGSIENNALCCPLCRLRIGSWVRTATKQKNLVNNKLWNFLRNKFSKQIKQKLRGEDIELPTEIPLIRLSEPGEIKCEYEAELQRLRDERLRLEQKQLQESESLIKQLQEEEETAHKKYLERLKHDEIFAKQLQQEDQVTKIPKMSKNSVIKFPTTQHRLKPTTIDSFLSKSTLQANITNNSPLITDDNTSTDITTPMKSMSSNSSRHSPEMLPNYGKLIKNIIDQKVKNRSSMWNKENGDTSRDKKEEEETNNAEAVIKEDKSIIKSKSGAQSLLVSLPLPNTGLLQKNSLPDQSNVETSSVDSMQQELCYFKPIEGTTPTSFNSNKSLPLRVPCLRANKEILNVTKYETLPSRQQYLENLCRLRDISLTQKLPSAFVIALSILKTKKENSKKYKTNTRSGTKKTSTTNVNIAVPLTSKRVLTRYKQLEMADMTKPNSGMTLRRTRSMGSIHKEDNEVTPKKKVKERKYHSDRKPYLRSDSKRMHLKRESCSPSTHTRTINNNKLNSAVKNLSSPLENCDVKNILREQLRIEKIIAQEKSDFEFARKMDAEWNGRRLRRAATKRQVSLAYALRPAKKLKV